MKNIKIVIAVFYIISLTKVSIPKKLHTRTVEHFSITDDELGFDDYEMSADTPPPELKKDMRRFYEYINRKKPVVKVKQKKTQPWYWSQKNDEWKEDYFDSNNEIKYVDHKREVTSEPDETSSTESSRLDKNDMRKEYLAKIMSNNASFHSNYKEDDKNNYNCSGDVGFGIQAFKCISQIEKINQLKSETIAQFLLSWTIIVVVVVISLWCAKGWCCCCCAFKFCEVAERLEEIQIFLANNPPGRLETEHSTYEYEPTAKEIMYYDNIAHGLMTV